MHAGNAGGAIYRSLVAVIDENAGNRDEIAKALASFYRVADYPDVEMAIGRLRTPPAAVVVDERVRVPDRGLLVRTLRDAHVLKDVPIIVCRARSRSIEDIGRTSGDVEPDALLEKPFRRSELINLVSGLINRKVEDGWAHLPPGPQKSLRETLAIFHGFADLIEHGEPLSQEKLNATCAPLLEVVTASQYQHVLRGVRGHDNYSYVHSVRVATLLTLFGFTIGLKESALMILATGGLVHDIGKMVIPHHVLNKPGKLTAEEWAVVRGHVKLSSDYLRKFSDVPKGVLTIATQHHERLDGSGYPNGLTMDKLNDLARMAAIVDVFAALTERRTYKAAMTPDEAFALMTEEMAGQLDLRLLKLFQEIFHDAVVREAV
ncbi:MAG: HD domain-containing protein [Magnetospirillum sp.]|nr:HD domain-containing protein [Magnetospirillum sp.]